VEYGPSPSVLEGPFTAKSYAASVQRSFDSPVTTEADLNRDGFAAGYAREWEQRGTHDYLQERVFQFQSDEGAVDWYESLRIENETSKYSISDIGGLEDIPRSFGVVLAYQKGSGHDYRVEFQKANLMFVVHAGSDSNDLTALAVGQAKLDARRI
jgi:hypothetical protein